jgi:hypothetical protein
MVTVIYILFLFALIHFIYENILLPSFRLKLRYRLFSLRDELRGLKFENMDIIDEKLYKYLQTSLNVTVTILYRIDIGTVLKVQKRYEKDKKFRERIERRAKLIDNLVEKCPIDKVAEIRREYLRVLEYAFLANSGSWFIYLVPIALVIVCLDKLNEFIKNISTIREHEVDEVVPSSSLAYSP